MAYTGFTVKLAYRAVKLEQTNPNMQQRVKEDYDTLMARFMGAPLTVQTYDGTANAIAATFVVPRGEIWLLYSIDIRIAGGTVEHIPSVHHDDYQRVSGAGGVPCGFIMSYQDVSAMIACGTADLEFTGPWYYDLYPRIIREGEYLYITAGAEPA